MSPDPRLKSVLGDPELAWLVERIRRRLEGGERLDGTVTLRAPTPAQREAVGRLFGTSGRRGAAVSVDLAALEAMLVAAGLCTSLRGAVEALVGPIVDARALRAQEAAEWARVYASLRERAATGAERAWVDDVCATGLLRRLSGQRPAVAWSLGEQVLAIAARLPARQLALAELAAAVSGDAHALDRGEPLAALSLRLVAQVQGAPVVDDAEGRREAWAAVGVLCDELSAPVLVLNLPAAGATPTARALRLHAEAGEPYRLSTRQLSREALDFAAERPARVFVCENPSVVIAAANGLAARSAPLVCIEGSPRTAARLLLGTLAAAGVPLYYHGDFDWPGVRIANLVIQRHGARPWRMSAEDYARAAGGGLELGGEPVAARWDAALEPAMRGRNRAVHEERVLDGLLGDLA